MSLLVLLFTVAIAFWLTSALDWFPGLLWGWIHWPAWTGWAAVLAFVSWCIGNQSAE